MTLVGLVGSLDLLNAHFVIVIVSQKFHTHTHTGILLPKQIPQSK